MIVTDDVDLDVPGHGGDVILQLQAVDAFVRTDARHHHQLRVRGLRYHGDALVRRGQLLFSEGPLGDGGRVPGDWDPDGEGLRDDDLQAFPEGAQVKGRADCRERDFIVFYKV